MTPDATAEELQIGPAETESPLFSVSAAAIAWLALGSAFVLLRLGPIWHMPVAGPELAHLSGAWQARIGVADDRFVATLFQALTALLLHFSDSEVPARVVAFATTATVPLAIWQLRPRLGEAGALGALALLAFDGPAIALGSSASAMGFDLAATAWLAVLIGRRDAPAWAWGVAAFLIATAGPIPLPLAVGGLAILFAAGDLKRERIAWAAGGVVLGVAVASLGFGTGSLEMRVPPFWLFAASFDQAWSTPNTLELGLLYVAPIVVAGLAGAALLLCKARRNGSLDRFESTLLAWAGVAVFWFLVSGTSHSPAPVVALTLPLSLTGGPALAAGFGAMLRADWRWARFLVPISVFIATIALVVMLSWARLGHATDNSEKALVFALLVLAAAALAITALQHGALGALFAPALLAGSLLLDSGAFGVAFNAAGEVTPSPVSPVQARQLRDTALQMAHDRGGLVAVHPRFEDTITWPFRDSGDIVVASRVPGDANVVIWPSEAPKPDGFNPVPNDWNLLVAPAVPADDFLVYLKWLSDRGSNGRTTTAATLYVRASQ